MSIAGFFINWTKKKIIWTAIIVIVGGSVWYFVAKGQDSSVGIQTIKVSRQDLQQTVLTTGQVVSAVNLDLGFQASGVVERVNVAAGDKVKAGDVLASLSQASVLASLTSAQGTLAEAQANYKKILAGATPEQINVLEKAVAAAQITYNNAVTNLSAIKESNAAAVSQTEKTLADLQSPTAAHDNKRSAIVVTISNQLAAVKASLDKQKQILDDQNLKDTFGIADIGTVDSFKSVNSLISPLLDKARPVQSGRPDRQVSASGHHEF
jgi:multidrug efflux pump subunit AcrA (membrane-fusion protein)